MGKGAVIRVRCPQIILLARLWKALGVSDYLRLEINTIATLEERIQYREKLIEYYQAHYEQLDEDSKSRLHKNPLRILDSKNREVKKINEGAPKLDAFLGEDSKAHFARVLALLDAAGVCYTINPTLVRGLDYYNHTVFEWITDELGSQGTVCGGGRYDGLTAHLGGTSIPGIGFAIGVERLLLLMEATKQQLPMDNQPLVYMILLSAEARAKGLEIAESLRTTFDDKQILVHLSQSSMKAQLKKADQSQAQFAVIIGEPELADNNYLIKDLQTGDQRHVNYQEIFDVLKG